MSKKNKPYVPHRPSGSHTLELDQLHYADDFTYYFHCEAIRQSSLWPDPKAKAGHNGAAPAQEEPYSIECEVKLVKRGSNPEISLTGRANLTRCFDQDQWALTVRRTGKIEKADQGKFDEFAENSKPNLKTSHGIPGWHAADKPSSPTHECLVSISDICLRLKGLIETPGQPASGLIVVSGSTNSGKSLVARGLMAELLHEKDCKKRRHHVITVEDPPEKYLAGTPVAAASITACQAQNVDYTVRFLGGGKDCPSLEAALQDARRQTPTIIYYGEVRNPDDWGPILDFAGSGHLIVTTTHAGSLVESLQHIAKAAGADTPAEIGDMASRILSSVHLRSLDYSDGSKVKSAILPAVWRRTSASIAQLVADGLSSVLPHNTRSDKTCGSFGRFYFAEELGITDATIKELALKHDLESR